MPDEQIESTNQGNEDDDEQPSRGPPDAGYEVAATQDEAHRECADQDVDSGDEAHLHDGAKPSERVYFHQK